MGIGSLVGAGISAAGSLFGGQQQAKASKQAAQMQYAAAMAAMQQQQRMFDQTQANIKPFIDVGGQAAGSLGNRLTELTTGVPLPPAMTQEELEKTPGYAFTLSQGLKATQGSAAARGLGLSGAAMKGAAAYATGLSDQTYNTRFNQAQQTWQNQVTNQTNNYNRLLGTAQLGSSAAGAQGQIAAYTGNNIANNLIAGGQAQANGALGQGSAWANMGTGLASAFNNALGQYMGGGGRLSNIFGGGGGGMYVDGAGTGWS